MNIFYFFGLVVYTLVMGVLFWKQILFSQESIYWFIISEMILLYGYSTLFEKQEPHIL